jgi:hypothetical protein
MLFVFAILFVVGAFCSLVVGLILMASANFPEHLVQSALSGFLIGIAIGILSALSRR